MFRSTIVIGVRTLLREKVVASITIAGFTVGIACSILIFLYVRYELGFDRYHEQADRIFRIEIDNWAATPIGVAPYVKQRFPDVVDAVRFLRANKTLVGTDREMFSEQSFFFADSGVFRIFSFRRISGDLTTALSTPNSLVLTRQTAHKYFGDQDPLGKTLKVETSQTSLYTITGVIEDPPEQSHFRFDFLASFCTLPFRQDNARLQWAEARVYSYVLLQPQPDLAAIDRDVSRSVHEHTGAPDSTSVTVRLRPITDIHLYSTCEKEIEPVSSIQYVYILSSVALIILVLAIVNFVNLSIARSMKRAREVALRKTLGALRTQIFIQFIGESILVTFLATLLAVGLVELVTPAFTALTGAKVSLLGGGHIAIAVALIGLVVIVGFAAGSYPALYVSRFQPVQILKGARPSADSSSSPSVIRNGLVILQFSVFIALMIGTTIIAQQLSYIQNHNIGLRSEQIVVVPVNAVSEEVYNTLKTEFLNSGSVRNVTASYNVPGERIVIDELRPQHALEESYFPRVLLTEFDFPETYGLTVKDGRSFSRNYGSDSVGAFLLNEKAAALFGWSFSVGQRIEYPSQHRSGQVVGVLKDFNYASLHSEIEPLVVCLFPKPIYYKYISLRLREGDKALALKSVEATWKRIAPGRPFEYYFLDESFRNLYRSERQLEGIVSAFTLIGMFIACLGLLGLMAQVVARRTKEIGIRKVLGASTPEIAGWIAREFLRLVVIANIVAWPLSWYIMNRWLESFAYHVPVAWWVFVGAGGAALVMAILTVSAQSIRAAMANPVYASRYE